MVYWWLGGFVLLASIVSLVLAFRIDHLDDRMEMLSRELMDVEFKLWRAVHAKQDAPLRRRKTDLKGVE